MSRTDERHASRGRHPINGGPGLVFSGAGRVVATVSFDIDAGGRITTIHNVVNPDKLRAVADGATHHLATR